MLGCSAFSWTQPFQLPHPSLWTCRQRGARWACTSPLRMPEPIAIWKRRSPRSRGMRGIGAAFEAADLGAHHHLHVGKSGDAARLGFPKATSRRSRAGRREPRDSVLQAPPRPRTTARDFGYRAHIVARVPPAVTTAIREGKKIAAIKIYRQTTGCGVQRRLGIG
jgi:hypothetical protein